MDTYIHGVLVNPTLPDNFFNCPNDERPRSHEKYFHVPFIKTRQRQDGTQFYDVWCLDGGAWDRPTWWGSVASLDVALDIAEQGRAYGWDVSARENGGDIYGEN